MPSARVCLLAAAAVCAVGTVVSHASAQTLPVPPYQTQGAYRVECRQEDELVLVIEPAYRAWVDRGRIRGWQFVTADGIPIQGRIGTNVNCRYELLPANAYPLTAFVNPEAEPPIDTTAGAEVNGANGANQTVTSRSAGTIEVEQLAPPLSETAEVPVTADPAPDPFASGNPTDSPPADETATAEPIELALAAPTITLPPLDPPASGQTSTRQAPTGASPASPPSEPAQPAPGPTIQAAEPQVTGPLPLAALPAVPPGAGSYWVQLGAFETVAEGHLAWAQLLNTAGWSDLAMLQPVMQRAAPAPGRVLHRLRVDVHTADRARALCTIQQTAGGECLMVGPGLTPDAWVADIAQPVERPEATVERVPFADSPMSASQAVPNWSVP